MFRNVGEWFFFIDKIESYKSWILSTLVIYFGCRSQVRSTIVFLVCPLPRKYVAIAGLAKELMEIQK